MNMELALSLSVLAACIAFSQILFILFGVVRAWSWIDISWSWIVGAMMTVAWWVGYRSWWMAVAILMYLLFTALRTHVWTRRKAREADRGSN